MDVTIARTKGTVTDMAKLRRVQNREQVEFHVGNSASDAFSSLRTRALMREKSAN